MTLQTSGLVLVVGSRKWIPRVCCEDPPKGRRSEIWAGRSRHRNREKKRKAVERRSKELPYPNNLTMVVDGHDEQKWNGKLTSGGGGGIRAPVSRVP